MAFTEQDRSDAYQFFVLMFNAAPGAVHGKEIATAYDAGATTAEIVATLTSKPAFQELFPTSQTPAQFAQAFVAQIVASATSQAVRVAAEADIKEALAAGWSQAQVITQIIANLQSKSVSDTAWGPTVELLREKIAIAQNLTEGSNASNATDWTSLSEPLRKLTETAPQEPATPPAPAVFTATLDGDGIVTFTNAGADITVTENAGSYTFTKAGATTGVTVVGPITGISVAASTQLKISSTLAAAGNGLNFPGAGTVVLSDTGAIAAGVLIGLEAKTTGLLDASSVSAIIDASSGDAHLLLVSKNGSSGNKIKTATDVAVTLTSTSASADQLKAIADATTGFVNASSVGIIEKSRVADVYALLVTQKGSTGDKIQLYEDPDVTLEDTTATYAQLEAISQATQGYVVVSSLDYMTGTLSQIIDFLASSKQINFLDAQLVNSFTLTDAITEDALNNLLALVGKNTITLADVPGNALTIDRHLLGPSQTLTIDGSGVSTAISIDASASDSNVIIKGGAGDDILKSGAGADVLSGGGGADTFYFSGSNMSTFSNMTTIADYRALGTDTIVVDGVNTMASNTSTVSDLSNFATVSEALRFMANVSTTDNGLSVFIWGGDTYAFIESSGAPTTYQPTDMVIKLTGIPFQAGTSILGLGIDGV